MKISKQAFAPWIASGLLLGLGPAPLLAQQICVDEITIPAIQTAFQAGTLTPTSLVQAYQARITAYDKQGPTINTILENNPEALAIAGSVGLPNGPLHGIPILLKDNIDTADQLHTSGGTLALANSIALQDSWVAQRLRQAGAVILGKANMTEYANFMSINMPSGYSSRGGQVLNPYNLAVDSLGIPIVTPGGSSSGPGASVAANLTTVAIGTETSGSILSPANQNGIVGIKPTVGLISRAGILPISATQDTAGPMARTVRDAAIVLGTLTGVDPRDPATLASVGKSFTDYTQFLDPNGLRGARIGVPTDVYYATSTNPQGFTQERLNIMIQVIKTLKRLGAKIVEANIATARQVGGPGTTTTVLIAPRTPPIPTPGTSAQVSTVLVYDFKHDLNLYLAGLAPSFPIKTLADAIAFNTANPATTLRFGQDILTAAEATIGDLSEPEYTSARNLDIQQSQTDGIDAYLTTNNLDAILFPSNRGAGIAAKAGYPSVLVPAGFTADGTPYGATFTGRAFSEPTLIKFAYAYEQATHLRRPPSSTPPLAGCPTP
ncbi:amidase family protein [Anthocerotibacter panamensis]|uniref:amidase family protein n=1 Tax=Anthocerotibacter panamensis TaxID=2857077 RepID=UPI001FD896B3|nr:amidase family protein [Anthocerotibacter panamensis]